MNNEIDPLIAWMEDLKNFEKDQRKLGVASQHHLIFNEVFPRMRALARILLEDAPPLEEEAPSIDGEQTVFIRVSTASNLRSYLSSIGTPEGLALFTSLEGDLTGRSPEEIRKDIEAAWKVQEEEDDG